MARGFWQKGQAGGEQVGEAHHHVSGTGTSLKIHLQFSTLSSLVSLQPPPELRFTTLTSGRLYLDCKVIEDHRCTLPIIVVFVKPANKNKQNFSFHLGNTRR